jgi:serine/threonine protein kinase
MSSEQKSTQTQCPQCSGVLTSLAAESTKIQYCQHCGLPLGEIANKYELVRLLAKGGCGVLYVARHRYLRLDPLRVIKFLPPHLFANVALTMRFAREVELTAALSKRNDHIVRVYDDFGDFPSLGHYFVMEYLLGQDLSALLRSVPELPLETILHIALQVGSAIHDAHQVGVVHRDLKPNNIFLISKGEDPYYVKVIDFGIAKSLITQFDTALTQGMVGTPAYMAPEQCQGKEVDHRTDIYALGIILYQMIVGHTPFFLPVNTEEYSPMQIAFAQISQLPRPPSEAKPSRPIPQTLEDLVLRALQKEPAQRFQSIADMNEALREIYRDLSAFDANQLHKKANSETTLPFVTDKMIPPQPYRPEIELDPNSDLSRIGTADSQPSLPKTDYPVKLTVHPATSAHKITYNPIASTSSNVPPLPTSETPRDNHISISDIDVHHLSPLSPTDPNKPSPITSSGHIFPLLSTEEINYRVSPEDYSTSAQMATDNRVLPSTGDEPSSDADCKTPPNQTDADLSLELPYHWPATGSNPQIPASERFQLSTEPDLPEAQLSEILQHTDAPIEEREHKPRSHSLMLVFALSAMFALGFGSIWAFKAFFTQTSKVTISTVSDGGTQEITPLTNAHRDIVNIDRSIIPDVSASAQQQLANTPSQSSGTTEPPKRKASKTYIASKRKHKAALHKKEQHKPDPSLPQLAVSPLAPTARPKPPRSQTPGCPADPADAVWLRLEIQPSAAQIRTKYHKVSQLNWYCLRVSKRGPRHYLTVIAEGYYTCYFQMPHGKNRKLQLKLHPEQASSEHELNPQGDYCLRK